MPSSPLICWVCARSNWEHGLWWHTSTAFTESTVGEEKKSNHDLWPANCSRNQILCLSTVEWFNNVQLIYTNTNCIHIPKRPHTVDEAVIWYSAGTSARLFFVLFCLLSIFVLGLWFLLCFLAHLCFLCFITLLLKCYWGFGSHTVNKEKLNFEKRPCSLNPRPVSCWHKVLTTRQKCQKCL